MSRKQFVTPPQRVALFVTCMVDMLYPDVGMATVELLEQAGIEVVFPRDQTCCGQPAFNSGFRDEARSVAQHFLDVFEPLVRMGEVDAIVAPSGSCITMVSHFYPTLFDPIKQGHDYQRAQTVAAASFEVSEFLVDVLGIVALGATGEGRVAYHACCHGLREMGIDKQPRALLGAVEGIEPTALREDTECCGFGGLFAIKNAPISEAMGQRKVRNIVESGAELVALCDVSCMTHINGMLSRQGHQCRAVHITQVLTGEAIAPPPLVATQAVKQQPAPQAAAYEEEPQRQEPRQLQPRQEPVQGESVLGESVQGESVQREPVQRKPVQPSTGWPEPVPSPTAPARATPAVPATSLPDAPKSRRPGKGSGKPQEPSKPTEVTPPAPRRWQDLK